MKNILFNNSSPDGGTYCFIDDLDRLDTFTSYQYDPRDIKHCKELIEFVINNPQGSKEFKHSTQQGFGNTFGADRGEIYDECGYFLINILHDCYKHTKAPFTVEHIVNSQSYI